VPAFALRAALGELAEEALLGGQRAVPEVLRRHGYRFRHPALAAALSALTGR
jgi:NAD dependent epimerase/dehydratase family enzyme